MQIFEIMLGNNAANITTQCFCGITNKVINAKGVFQPLTGKTPFVVACPGCRKKVPWHDNSVRPFCSERCRLIDLGAWSDESYSIKGAPAPSAESDDMNY